MLIKDLTKHLNIAAEADPTIHEVVRRASSLIFHDKLGNQRGKIDLTTHEMDLEIDEE